jgi:Plasmid encoded RepA protein
MTKSRGKGGPVQVGQIPLLKKLAKKFAPPTRAQLHLVETAGAIREQPDAAERAFMARQLVLCTLPHSDPGNVEAWTRRSGGGSLTIQRGWDADAGRSIGYPYGTIPRLLLFWIITEAVQTKSRRLVLGRSLAEFMRALRLDPNRGGKRSDHKRLKEQMRRLFRCHITFQATLDQPNGVYGERSRDMAVAPESELWWNPHQPEQGALWESWIELGEKFFEAVIASPVPLDMRALRALKNSALALDLYSWVSYRTFVIVQKNQPPQFTPWTVLMRQLGTGYGTANDFQKKASRTLRKIAVLYPGLTIGKAKGGFTIHATRLAVPQKPRQNSLDSLSYPR